MPKMEAFGSPLPMTCSVWLIRTCLMYVPDPEPAIMILDGSKIGRNIWHGMSSCLFALRKTEPPVNISERALTCEHHLVVAVVAHPDFEVDVVIPNCLGRLPVGEFVLHHVVVEQRNFLVFEELES